MDGLVVVAALPAEARVLEPRAALVGQRFELAPGVTLFVCGVGPDAAARGARALLAEGARALVSWGTAGGLDPALAVGRLVLPAAIVDDGEPLATDAAWRARLERVLAARLDVVAGDLAASPSVLDTAARKAELFGATGAVAVDMESGALARAARGAGVPFLAVRAVCDGHDMVVPRSAKVAIDGHGRLQPLRFARALLARPVEAADLWRLDRGFRAARRTLAAVARLAGPDLALGPR